MDHRVEGIDYGYDSTFNRNRFSRYSGGRAISIEAVVMREGDNLGNLQNTKPASRQDAGAWLLRPFSGLDAVAKVQSLEIELPLSEIYAGIEFVPA